ncbi:MAG: FAD:protein FMN transferase [Clostridia bacterium]|nr:FAD:protein FMN transferase [Clostridia bacterium]
MKTIQKLFTALGTVNSITIWCKDDQSKAMRQVLENIERAVLSADDRWSLFKEKSELNRLAAAAGTGSVAVQPDTIELFQIAKEYAALTGGAFDITAQVSGARGDYRDILPDADGKTVTLRHGGMRADFGGIAKGYVADRIVGYLRANGVDRALINLGGTVYSLGQRRTIGIRNPFAPLNEHYPEQSVAFLESEEEFVVTSGVYEQKEHIINPVTGQFVDSDLLSVTVVGKNGAAADAMATACMVLNLATSINLLEQMHLEAIFITMGGNVIATRSLRKRLTMANMEVSA